MTATQLPSTPSSTALPIAPHGATSPQHPTRLPLPAIPSYEVLLQQQEESRGVFGRMLLNWRRRNGWTQYTACNWAEAIGEPSLVISYGRGADPGLQSAAGARAPGQGAGALSLLPGGIPAGFSPSRVWVASWSMCSAQPHVHRLEPLHPPVLTLLAMQHGVPMAPAPVGPARGAAAGASRGAL